MSKPPCVEVQLLSERKLDGREQSCGLGDRGEGSLEGFWDCFLVERPNLEGDEILDLKEIIMNNGWTELSTKSSNELAQKSECDAFANSEPIYIRGEKCERDTITNPDM